MTTTPVMTLTDELLAEIEDDAILAPRFGLHRLVIRVPDVLSMITELRQLRAECQALRVGAGRYRWLRESMWYVGPDTCESNEGGGIDGYCNENFMAENLDESIDTAMQAKK